jgi:hypothetical protein
VSGVVAAEFAFVEGDTPGATLVRGVTGAFGVVRAATFAVRAAFATPVGYRTDRHGPHIPRCGRRFARRWP